ncbi:MAG: maleylpyruvate isomerase N-terminal domain-containing protein [Actinomycetota bacterium]
MSIHEDRDRLYDTIESEGRRLAELVRNVQNPDAIAVGRWNERELADHLSLMGPMFADFARDAGPASADATKIEQRYESLGQGRGAGRPMSEMADLLQQGIDGFVVEARRAEPDRVVTWHGGAQLTLPQLGGILMGEIFAHGIDMATAEGTTWEVPHEQAVWLVEGTIPVLPLFVDRPAAAGFSGTFDINLRRGPRMYLAFRDGELKVEASATSVDCHINADPVDFVLVSYGRRSQWNSILRGKILAYGRKPWLGLKLNSLLLNP